LVRRASPWDVSGNILVVVVFSCLLLVWKGSPWVVAGNIFGLCCCLFVLLWGEIVMGRFWKYVCLFIVCSCCVLFGGCRHGSSGNMFVVVFLVACFCRFLLFRMVLWVGLGNMFAISLLYSVLCVVAFCCLGRCRHGAFLELLLCCCFVFFVLGASSSGRVW